MFRSLCLEGFIAFNSMLISPENTEAFLIYGIGFMVAERYNVFIPIEPYPVPTRTFKIFKNAMT